MDNDEKTAPRSDDILPPDGDMPSQDTPDSARAASKDAGPGVKPAKTVPFPGARNDTGARSEAAAMAREPSPLSLDDSFGMPDFAFFSDSPARETKLPPAPPEIEVEATPVADAGMSGEAAVATASLPLQEGTGWETVGSIMKSASLRARIEAQEVDEAVIGQLFANDDEAQAAADADQPAASRSEAANVTPFPGTVVQRAAERAPSDLLRGGGKSAEVFDDISTRAGDETAAPAGDTPANPDALADAVQSALRNIYGAYPEQADERTDMSGFTVADALAGADGPVDEAAWAEERPLSPEWQQSARVRDYEAAPSAEAQGADSEAVLDYFYSQQRRQERAAPQLSAEMSLNDYAARAAREEKWQEDEPEEEPQRVMQFPRDRAQGNYRGRPELSTAGEMPLGRSADFFRSDPVRPSLEAEWGQPPYGAPPQNARGTITPTYAPTVATPADQMPPAQGPDSGHLLGAAGLGLIGGIALAGVLAVFVFNSFVDENGQTGQDSGPKVVERLAPAQTAANPLEARAPVSDNRSTEAPASTQSSPPAAEEPQAQPQAQPQRQAALTPPPQPVEAAKPKLSATPATGAPDSLIRLNIVIGDVDVGEALVSLKGLPKDSRLSTGIDVGGGQWLLPPGRLKDLTVTAPPSAAGSHSLEAQLLKDDAQTSLSDAVPFTLNIGPSRPAAGQPAPGAAPAPQKAESSRLAVLPDEAQLPETDFLTQMLIRDGNKKMREGDIAGARRLYEQAAASGNAEAALAMGRSYDPTYFEKLNVRTGKPDPATAFEWYKKALDGGLVTAKVKIDALKQWLQR